MEKLFSDSKKIASASEKSFWEALNVFSTRKIIFLILQNNVSKAGKIFSAVEKIVTVLENISFDKKMFGMIQIVFGTIKTIVRAEQKVISASPATFSLRTCCRKSVVISGARLQVPSAAPERVLKEFDAVVVQLND